MSFLPLSLSLTLVKIKGEQALQNRGAILTPNLERVGVWGQLSHSLSPSLAFKIQIRVFKVSGPVTLNNILNLISQKRHSLICENPYALYYNAKSLFPRNVGEKIFIYPLPLNSNFEGLVNKKTLS